MSSKVVVVVAIAVLSGCSSAGVVAEAPDAEADTDAEREIDTSTPPDPFDSTPPDTFRPVPPDTWIADTSIGDTWVTDTATPDAPPYTADRALSLLFASPDLAGRFVCFGAFLSGDDPSSKLKPIDALPRLGALGVPDPSAPSDMTKTTAFQFGAVSRVPLTEPAVAALESFTVVAYLLDANPALTASSCSDQWSAAKGDPRRWTAIPKGTIRAGEHGLLNVRGCVTSTTCASPIEVRVDKLSTTRPPFGTLGIQFLHLSADPAWQNIDVYLWPQSTPTGTSPVKHGIANNVRYGSMTTMALGISFGSESVPEYSSLLIVPHGGTDCPDPPPTSCPNYVLPLAPFLGPTGYPRTGGGLFTGTNQLVVLAGSPQGAMIPFVRASTW